MEQKKATQIFESLSSGIRLDIFRLLVKFSPDGLVAGEIGEKLGLPPTNLSFHLKALVQADLATVDQEGRYQRYRANITTMHDVIAYLTSECCCNDPDKCNELREKSGITKILDKR